MKTLELNQMENVNGGDVVESCAGGAAVAAIGVAATLLSGGTFGFAAVLGMGWAMRQCSNAAAAFGR